MTSIDDKIKQALSDEYQDLIDENNKFDTSIIEQFDSGFKGKIKKSYKILYNLTIVFYIISAILAYNFYGTENVKTLMAYAFGALFFNILAMFGEQRCYSEVGRTRIINEIKIVELQLAQVLKNQDKG